MPLEIRLLKESELKAVNDFYNNTAHIDRPAPKAVRSYSEFCWEFIDCPYGKTIYAGAWENEAGKEPLLVGIQSIIPLKMVTQDGKQILTGKGEATLIDVKALIKYKKTDILKELFDILIPECRKEGIEFLWGFNNIPATYNRLGFENPFKSSHGLLILKPYKAFKNITSLKPDNTGPDNFKIAIRTASAAIFSLKKLLILSRKNNYRFNFELDENDKLFSNVTPSGKFIFLWQDKNYFNWRISKNPYPINYRSFQLLNENNLLVAQVICSIQKDVAFIEQTLFDRKMATKHCRSFLKRIIRLLEKENVCLIRYTGFKNNKLNLTEMDLLKSLGFVFTGKGDWFTFKNLSSDPVIDPENIYLSRMYKQGVN